MKIRNNYTYTELERAFGCGRNFQLTGENNFRELVEEFNKMKSKEYVNQIIENLLIKFPEIKLRYKIDEGEHSSDIEILPLGYTNKNKNLLKFINLIYVKFIEEYPSENITFYNSSNREPMEVAVVKTGDKYLSFGHVTYKENSEKVPSDI